MSALIRGTTPTIQFVFTEVSVSDITAAYLTIKQRCTNVIEKDISSATKDTTNNTLSWTLTQAESLQLAAKVNSVVCCDWLVGSTRGRSNMLACMVECSGKDEVIA